MNDLREWFQKNDLCPENILYLYRSDRKTVVHRMDGEEAALYAPLHSVLSVLPENLFLNISKGIAVCRSQIVNISNDGIYTMSDGRTFQGRKRGLSDHRRLRAEIGLADTLPRRGFYLPLLQRGDGNDRRGAGRRNAEPLFLRGVPQW